MSDSGWIYPELSAEFKIYSDVGQTPKYRKVGSVVEICGAVSPVSQFPADTTRHTIFTLPEGFRPVDNDTITTICQGSGTAVWLLRVIVTGDVIMERYREGDAYATSPTNAWLSYCLTFLAG